MSVSHSLMRDGTGGRRCLGLPSFSVTRVLGIVGPRGPALLFKYKNLKARGQWGLAIAGVRYEGDREDKDRPSPATGSLVTWASCSLEDAVASFIN